MFPSMGKDETYGNSVRKAMAGQRGLTASTERDSMRRSQMATPDNPATVSRLRSRTWLVLAVVGAGGLALAAVIFFSVGRWLVVEDPLAKAMAIVVLNGAIPLRAIEAAKLYREGYAPEIWLTRAMEPGKTLQDIGVPFSGEDYYDKLVLIHEGVPPGAIHVLEPPIVNTADEIKVVAAGLAPAKGEAVILVTTKVHTRRVRLLWRRLALGQGRAIVRAASSDPFDPRRWWRTTGGALDVVREVLGLLNAWAGLPLHPAQ
jgi:uncharacterized SAM-binding protein YcdF (DUF218 family)